MQDRIIKNTPVREQTGLTKRRKTKTDKPWKSCGQKRDDPFRRR